MDNDPSVREALSSAIDQQPAVSASPAGYIPRRRQSPLGIDLHAVAQKLSGMLPKQGEVQAAPQVPAADVQASAPAAAAIPGVPVGADQMQQMGQVGLFGPQGMAQQNPMRSQAMMNMMRR
jgi:hypothetical protein